MLCKPHRELPRELNRLLNYIENSAVNYTDFNYSGRSRKSVKYAGYDAEATSTTCPVRAEVSAAKTAWTACAPSRREG